MKKMDIYNLVSLLGVFLLLGLAWLLSANRQRINLRVIVWGMGIQFLFALFVFLFPPGIKLFLWVNDVVVRVLECAGAGTRFLFGRLALPPGAVGEGGETSLGFFLAFQALPTVIFFSALMGLLYHLGVMPFLIKCFSSLFTRIMRISGAESLCVSSNIFVGIESALTIRPYLKEMTISELFTILTAGMSTIASSVLALYVFVLKDSFPGIAGHLVSASILSAPAALVMAKILLPETEVPKTLGLKVKPHWERANNIIEAIINGANSGVRLVVGICALLIAFLGLLALLDLVLVWIGGRVNEWSGIGLDLSTRGLLGYIFYPFTVAIGVPLEDAGIVAEIIGERTVATEVRSYMHLADALGKGLLFHPRSKVIATYALCGFAHVASLAIFVGGIGALVPGRIKDLSTLGLRALLAATLACLMTGAVAGVFFVDTQVLLR